MNSNSLTIDFTKKIITPLIFLAIIGVFIAPGLVWFQNIRLRSEVDIWKLKVLENSAAQSILKGQSFEALDLFEKSGIALNNEPICILDPNGRRILVGHGLDLSYKDPKECEFSLKNRKKLILRLDNGMPVGQVIFSSPSVITGYNFLLFSIGISFLGLIIILRVGWYRSRDILHTALKQLAQTLKSALTARLEKDAINSSVTLPPEFYDVQLKIDETLDYVEKLTNNVTDLNVKAKLGQQAIELAHDLRSPITALKVALSNLSIESENKELADSAIERLESICSGILFKYKSSRSTDLSCLFDDVIQETSLAYSKVACGLIRIEKESPSIFIPFEEAVILRSALQNLVNNAVEALEVTSTENRCVHLLCEKETDLIKITIKDNGPGLPDEVIKAGALNEFTSKPLGNGIGLKSVFRVISDLGGRLDLLTSARGTTFNIVLPKLN